MHSKLKAFTNRNTNILHEDDADTMPELNFVKMKRSARARRISLRLDNKNRHFVLTIPRGCSIRKASQFARNHEDWMLEKLEELPEQELFEHGAVFPILGYNRTIEIYYNKNLRTTDIILKQNRLTVYSNQEDPTSRIERYLKKLAKDTMTEMAHEKAALINKKINKISVRDTKTRWGSCSSQDNISLSWRLIFAPFEAMDYVVAHEVAHLKHLDHSKSFWSVCRDLSDDYFEGHHWMKTNGHELMRFG